MASGWLFCTIGALTFLLIVQMLVGAGYRSQAKALKVERDRLKDELAGLLRRRDRHGRFVK